MLLKWYLAALYLRQSSPIVDRWVQHTLVVYCPALMVVVQWTVSIVWQFCIVISPICVTSRLMHLLQHCSLLLPFWIRVLAIRKHQLMLQSVSQQHWLSVQVQYLFYSHNCSNKKIFVTVTPVACLYVAETHSFILWLKCSESVIIFLMLHIAVAAATTEIFAIL